MRTHTHAAAVVLISPAMLDTLINISPLCLLIQRSIYFYGFFIGIIIQATARLSALIDSFNHLLVCGKFPHRQLFVICKLFVEKEEIAFNHISH